LVVYLTSINVVVRPFRVVYRLLEELHIRVSWSTGLGQ